MPRIFKNNGRKVIDYWRSLVRVLLPAVLVSLCPACQSQRGREPLRLAAPVGPDVQAIAFAYDDCTEKADRSGKQSAIRELLLTYVNSGRNFDNQTGPDGYVLRVIPLDQASRPRQAETDLHIALFARYEDASASSVEKQRLTWTVPAARLPEYWVRTRMLDGYLLRLSCRDRLPPPGEYVLRVRLLDGQEPNQTWICQKISFQDIEPAPKTYWRRSE